MLHYQGRFSAASAGTIPGVLNAGEVDRGTLSALGNVVNTGSGSVSQAI